MIYSNPSDEYCIFLLIHFKSNNVLYSHYSFSRYSHSLCVMQFYTKFFHCFPIFFVDASCAFKIHVMNVVQKWRKFVFFFHGSCNVEIIGLFFRMLNVYAVMLFLFSFVSFFSNFFSILYSLYMYVFLSFLMCKM